MYFLEHGRVEIVLPTGQLVNTLTDGAYFGGKQIEIKLF